MRGISRNVADLWAFIAGWRLINPEYAGWRQLPLAAAFAIQCVRDWLWLRPLARGDKTIGDVFASESGMGLILGQLALWLLLWLGALLAPARAAEPIPAEAFFRHPALLDVRLSPAGTRVAITAEKAEAAFAGRFWPVFLGQ